MVLNKSFELLSQLFFKIVDSWISPLHDILNCLSKGSLNDGPNEEPPKEITRNLLLFLSIMVEEFHTTNLTFQARQRVKQAILSEEQIVFQLFRHVLTTQTDEKLLISVVSCCTTWISRLSTVSDAVVGVEFMGLIYRFLLGSPALCSICLDCLITLLDEGGIGLTSGRDTVNLLDFHLCHLAQLHDVMVGLIADHSRTLGHDDATWEEFDQYELLTKTVLLCASLADKQMDQLIKRLVRSTEPNDSVRIVCRMLLMPLSIAGHYPREECVSDLGIQIWFNLLDADLPDRNGSDNPAGWDFIQQLHSEFLEAAFKKCKYTNTVSRFTLLRSSDEQDAWYKYRTELADTFLSAYTGQRSPNWFSSLCDRVPPYMGNINVQPDHWQDIENILFILASIGEQAVSEMSQTNDHIIITFINRLPPLMSSLMTMQQTDRAVQSQILLYQSILNFLTVYLPVLVHRLDFNSELWSTNVLQFILGDLKVNKSLFLRRLSIGAAVKALKMYQEHLLRTTEQADTILDALEGADLAIGQSGDAKLWNCCGSLVSLSPSNPSLERFVNRRLEQMGLYFESTSTGSSTMDSELTNMLKLFTEFFNGIFSFINKQDDSGSSLRTPHTHSEQTVALASQVLMRLVSLFLEADARRMKYTAQLPSLLQSGLNVCIQSGVDLTTAPHASLVYSLLEQLVRLVDRLLTSDSKLNKDVLSIAWLLSRTLLTTTQRVDLHAVGWQLLHGVLQRIDSVMTNEASSVIHHQQQASMDSTTVALWLRHPISPLLMARRSPEIGDQIEASAEFLQHLVDYKLPTVSLHHSEPLLCTFHRHFNDTSHSGWRLSLTVGLAGLSVPEWPTTERCLLLTKQVLTHLTMDTSMTGIRDSVLTLDLFFQLHTVLLLILLRGALPKRLVSKFANIYSTISPIVPDKQFSLLQSILSLTDPSPLWRDLFQTNSDVLNLIRTAVESVSVAERDRFARTVTRAAMPINAVRQSINAFVNSASSNASE